MTLKIFLVNFARMAKKRKAPTMSEEEIAALRDFLANEKLISITFIDSKQQSHTFTDSVMLEVIEDEIERYLDEVT